MQIQKSKIQRFDELSSSQVKAFEILQQNGGTSLWIVAKNQTAGRGRLQRAWQSQTQNSLTATYAFRADVRSLEGLSLVVGLGVLEGLAHIQNLKLKWPNDLMLEDQKVGGILIESHSLGDIADVAVGIGINLFDFRGLDGVSYAGIGQSIEEDSFFSAVENKIGNFLSLKQGFRPFVGEYQSRMWGLGREVEMRMQDKSVKVEILGVSERGLLNTRNQGVLEILDTGEIVGGIS